MVLVLIGLYRLVKKGIQTLAYLTKTRNKKHRARWWVIRRSSQPGSALPLVITIMTSIVLVVGIALLFRVSLKRFITSFQTTDQPNTFILNVRTDDREPLSTILSGAVFYDIIL